MVYQKSYKQSKKGFLISMNPLRIGLVLASVVALWRHLFEYRGRELAGLRECLFPLPSRNLFVAVLRTFTQDWRRVSDSSSFALSNSS